MVIISGIFIFMFFTKHAGTHSQHLFEYPIEIIGSAEAGFVGNLLYCFLAVSK